MTHLDKTHFKIVAPDNGKIMWCVQKEKTGNWHGYRWVNVFCHKSKKRCRKYIKNRTDLIERYDKEGNKL